MESIVLVLVVISGILHTTWNFILKKTINNCAEYHLAYWMSYASALVILFVPFLVSVFYYGISFSGIITSMFAGIFLSLYIILLSKSYKEWDMSIVYPVAKTTPLFTMILGVFILNEKVTTIGVIGIILIVFGAYSINSKKFSDLTKPILSFKIVVFYALLLAIISAGYGFFSKIGTNKINAFQFEYLFVLFGVLFCIPFMKKYFNKIIPTFKDFKREMILVGLLDMGGYVLILIALSISTLSYIFALRQVSIIFTVIASIVLLKEKHGFIRIISGCLIFAGIILISIGG